MHQNLISTKIYQVQQNVKFLQFLCIGLWVTVSTKLWRHTYRLTDRHFLKMVKSCSGYLKVCKSIKTRMSKIFTNPMLSSYAYRIQKKFSLSFSNSLKKLLFDTSSIAYRSTGYLNLLWPGIVQIISQTSRNILKVFKVSTYL